MLREEWRAFWRGMHCDLIIVPVLVNNTTFADAIIDTGCLCYALCDPRFAQRNNLERIKITPIQLEAFNGEKAPRPIREVAEIDLEGHKERMWFYVTPLGGHDMYLGMPWIRRQRVAIEAGGKRIRIGPRSISATVCSKEAFKRDTVQVSVARLVSAASWRSVKNQKGGGT